VRADKKRQQRLFGPRKSWEIREAREIGTMLVVLVVCDGQSDFVQPRRPRKCRGVIFVESPVIGDLYQKLLGAARHALGLCAVNVIARTERRDGLFAHIMVLNSPDQVMEKSFAQRVLRDPDLGDVEFLKSGDQNRDTTRKYRRALRAQAWHPQGGLVAGRDQCIPQLVECGTRDDPTRPAGFAHHCANRAYRAG